MSDERNDARVLEIALKLADGEAVALDALDGLDARLARGFGRLAAIAKQCAGDAPTEARWGHLRNLRPAGSGSYGEVFRAYDPTLDRDVALKLKRVDGDGHHQCRVDAAGQRGQARCRDLRGGRT